MIQHLLSAALVAVSAYASTQTHPLVGAWEMQLPGAVRMENGEQTITYVKGSLEVVLQGDSLIATLASEPVEGRPARPPARLAAKSAPGSVTFTHAQRGNAEHERRGGEANVAEHLCVHGHSRRTQRHYHALHRRPRGRHGARRHFRETHKEVARSTNAGRAGTAWGCPTTAAFQNL